MSHNFPKQINNVRPDNSHKTLEYSTRRDIIILRIYTHIRWSLLVLIVVQILKYELKQQPLNSQIDM